MPGLGQPVGAAAAPAGPAPTTRTSQPSLAAVGARGRSLLWGALAPPGKCPRAASAERSGGHPVGGGTLLGRRAELMRPGASFAFSVVGSALREGAPPAHRRTSGHAQPAAQLVSDLAVGHGRDPPPAAGRLTWGMLLLILGLVFVFAVLKQPTPATYVPHRGRRRALPPHHRGGPGDREVRDVGTAWRDLAHVPGSRRARVDDDRDPQAPRSGAPSHVGRVHGRSGRRVRALHPRLRDRPVGVAQLRQRATGVGRQHQVRLHEPHADPRAVVPARTTRSTSTSRRCATSSSPSSTARCSPSTSSRSSSGSPAQGRSRRRRDRAGSPVTVRAPVAGEGVTGDGPHRRQPAHARLSPSTTSSKRSIRRT